MRRSLLRGIRVMGIDPGISSCGWCTGVISFNKATLLEAGVITTKADKKSDSYKTIDDQARAIIVFEGLNEIIRTFTPGIIAIETPIGGARSSQAVKFIGMSSMLIAVLVSAHHHVNRYSPYEMKEKFTGSKKADKHDMIARAEDLYPGLLDHLNKTSKEHAADAVAALHMELP